MNTFYKKLSLAKFEQSFVGMLFIFMVLGTDFISSAKFQDNNGLQWTYLSLVNVFGYILLVLNKNEALETLNKVIRHKIFGTFLVFSLLCIFSIFFSINPKESLVDISKLITTFLLFINLSVFFKKDKKFFFILSVVFSTITLIQSIYSLQLIYLRSFNPYEALKWTTGNKNIFAISTVLKLPFLIYIYWTSKSVLLKLSSLIVFLLATHLIFLSSARTSLIALILTLTLLIIGKFYIDKKSNVKENITFSVFVIILTTFAFFPQSLSQNNQKTSTQRLVETSKGDIRLDYWKNAIDIINENPITGVGYGNYKIHSAKYIKHIQSDGIFSIHPHNDFLFIAAETGIINLSIYLSIFIFAFLVIWKEYRKNNSTERGYIYLVLVACLVGYGIDSMFNFPHERPITQIFLMLLLAITVKFTLSENNKTSKNFIGIILSILAITTLFFNYNLLKTLRAQGILDTDISNTAKNANRPLQLNFTEAKQSIGTYPTISDTYQSNGYKLAIYLRNEKRYEEALHMLDSVKQYHPYVSHHDELKFKIYLEDLKNKDSAYVYGRKAVEGRPKNFNLLVRYLNLLIDLNKTQEIEYYIGEYYKWNTPTEEQKDTLEKLTNKQRDNS